MIPCIVDGKPLSARATARSAAHTLMHEFDAINRGHMPECENVLVIASKRFDSNAVEHRDTQRSRLNWYSRAASFAPMFNSKWYAEKIEDTPFLGLLRKGQSALFSETLTLLSCAMLSVGSCMPTRWSEIIHITRMEQLR